jgi:tetratricopeptide (TPR) repeat protein
MDFWPAGLTLDLGQETQPTGVKINIAEALLFLAGMVALGAFFWRELFRDDEVYDLRWMAGWIFKGVLIPSLVWVALNTGSRPFLPALVHIRAPAGPGRIAAVVYGVNYVCTQTAPALCVIGSYWAALTLGWLGWASAKRVGDREGFFVSAAIWCGLLSPVVAVLIYVYGFEVMGLALLFWFGPIAYLTIHFDPPKTRPAYAQAVASLKFGRYAQAEKAILAELEKCETDFDGWLMLAELYAKQFHDPGEAERSIYALCDEPATSLAQAAIALNRLADWQLQLRGDPDAARRALQEIVRRGPGTHLAKMAELRMKQLPATRAEWQEQHQAHTIHLPALGNQLDAPDHSTPQLSRSKAIALANQCVEKLKMNPADIPTREKFAHLLADQLNNPGQAIQQIESLMELTDQPPDKMAGWHAQIAAWEIKRGAERQVVRQRLERLLREHPASVHALAARRRLALLDDEDHAAQTPQIPPTPAIIRLPSDGAA